MGSELEDVADGIVTHVQEGHRKTNAFTDEIRGIMSKLSGMEIEDAQDALTEFYNNQLGTILKKYVMEGEEQLSAERLREEYGIPLYQLKQQLALYAKDDKVTSKGVDALVDALESRHNAQYNRGVPSRLLDLGDKHGLIAMKIALSKIHGLKGPEAAKSAQEAYKSIKTIGDLSDQIASSYQGYHR